MKVIKRNGVTVDFDKKKIKDAIGKAIEEVGKFSHGAKWSDYDEQEKDSNLNSWYSSVYDMLKDKFRGHVQAWEVEEIQDAVEQVLMKEEPAIAKAFIIYRQKRTEQRDLISLEPDPNAIANYIHPSKYARYMKNLKRRETYEETVSRVLKMHRIKFPHLEQKIMTAFNFVFQKKILPSMRSMQFAGQAITDHNTRIYNCSFSHIDRPKVFSEMLYLLLCGCGCGFSK